MKRPFLLILVAAWFPCALLPGQAATTADWSALIDPILKADLEGAGNTDAQVAWKALVEQAGPKDTVALLSRIDSTKPLASNWIRSAVETLASSDVEKLPLEELKSFVLDSEGDPKARDLAFQLLRRGSEKEAASLVPGFLQDSSLPLRRLAVAHRMNQAEALREQQPDQAKASFQEALDGARDVDQIKAATKALRDLGEGVDLPRQMGFLTHWHVIGPFDNEGRKGHQTAYGPETNLDLAAEHQGKNGTVKWQPLASADEFGMLDFNKPYGLIKETIGYAQTSYESAEERDVEIRLGCKNAWKVWLNGELLFERDEYHRGINIDQYAMPCRLKKGTNIILVKCAQNEQQERWTVEWQFQLRVCDQNGTAVLATDRPPTPKPEDAAPNDERRRR